MKNSERKKAKRMDLPLRSSGFTQIVYGGKTEDPWENYKRLNQHVNGFKPKASPYNVYFGELHGHSNLSDGTPDIDTYFLNVRDNAKLDFCALTDHDHGGVGREELFGEKWETIKNTVKKYYQPHKFTTILGYERDSYPWYNNAVVYYNNHDAEMLRGQTDGEISRQELREYLNRDDVIMVPHDTCFVSAGTDFLSLDKEDMPPLIQVFSRGSYCEKYDERFLTESAFFGGFWQDALKKGAKMGCICASDDHLGRNGIIDESKDFPFNYPGITAVLAKENTLQGIFEALKNRRCYGFMYGRVYIDFRINEHFMGEEITLNKDEIRSIYFNINADQEIKNVTLVKNCKDYIVFGSKHGKEQVIFDYEKEQETDYYYLRVLFKDGTMAWTSPIWITEKDQ